MNRRIVLADDHQMVRDGIRAQIASLEGVEVVGEASDGQEAVSLCRELRPDIAIMDLGMPILNGVEATRQIVETLPGCSVIVLSMHSEQRYVSEALQAGASGYVLKDAAFDELASAIEAVGAGRAYLSPGVQAAVVEHYGRRASSLRGEAPRALTPREREILQLIAEGMSTKQIASALGLSVKTVETHRRQVMEKTDANSVADLVRYALREGYTTLDR